jgi:uracil-DNA glycosylase
MHKEKQLKRLEAQMKKADLPLKATATNLVFGRGRADSKVFFIGEAPGRHEDIQGIPFIGACGKLLDQLFESAGITREEVYITSILKYRPPKNRPPQLDEIKAHTPFLVRQITTIQPQVILPLGNFATRFVLAGFDTTRMSSVLPITAVHGKEHTVNFDCHEFTVMPLYHPAAALYNRSLLPSMLKDIKKARKLADLHTFSKQK